MRHMPKRSGERQALFGPFQFDLISRELRKNGVRLPLEDKPAKVLTTLVMRPGVLVSREELQEQLWPGGEHVDYSHGLNKSVNKLRFALGDAPGKPRYIETLSRRGYRFLAPVQLVSEAEVRSQSAREEETGEQPPVSPLHSDRIDHGASHIVIASNRGMVIGSLIAVFLVLGFLAAGRLFGLWAALRSADRGIKSLVIEKNGALDPTDEGFKLHPIGKYEVGVMPNTSHQGWDRFRLISNDQTYYYRTLTSAEKDFALSHDWKLLCTCAIEQGGLSTNVDFGPGSRRFDMDLLREGNKYYVALAKQISPKMNWEQKIEFSGVRDIDRPHTYELRYDHSKQTADLWVDGRLMASGYGGHTQFVEDRGVILGAFRYSSDNLAVGVFRTVRFEVH